MRRWALGLLLVALIAVAGSQACAPQPRAAPQDPVIVYFFWGEGCPHCAAAKPVLAELGARYPRLEVRDFEVWGNAANQRLFVDMAAKFGFEPTGVPTFFVGEKYWVGFDKSTTPSQLDAEIVRCLTSGCPDAGAGVFSPAPEPAPDAPLSPDHKPSPGVIKLPIVGEIDAATQSLALSTTLIALVDGFNPCSLWVLSVLLALTLRTGSRRTIAVIGLVFITVAALVYALFIAGLFSVFTVVSFAPWMRAVVVLIAGVFGVINIKDFFWFRQGVSLTIPESRKPGIYQRMRDVLDVADSMPALIAATALLAAGVSVVELACTAGFPVLWTNIVAAREVTPIAFALLLALYMLVYQLDELAIFGTAVVTMRATKLQERQGRLLKLAGGMLMLSLAIVMIVNPSLMYEARTALLVFAVAGAATVVVWLIHRIVLPRLGIATGTNDKTPAHRNR